MVYNALCKLLAISFVFINMSWAEAPTRSQHPHPAPLRFCAAGGRAQVNIPDAASRAIMALDSTFCRLGDNQYDPQIFSWYQRSRSQAPQTVYGDFNNDGRRDVAVMGQSQSNKVVVYVAIAGAQPGQYSVTQVGSGWPCRDGQINWCRNMGRDPLRITRFPYYLTLAENEQEGQMGLNISVDHLKYESTGVQEQVYYYSQSAGGFRPAQLPAGRGVQNNGTSGKVGP